MVCGILSGCGSVSKALVPGANMLDTAPKANTELRHPEWGYLGSMDAIAPPERQTTSSAATVPQNVTSLEMFLDRHNIAHETIRGGHLIVRLKELAHFQTGSAQLSLQSQNWLRSLGHYLSGWTDVDIVIDGHTDNSGAVSFNDTLSEQRAREVEKQLIKTNFPRQRVFSRGFGEHVPQCSNSTSSGKACNRRVELMLIVSE